MSRVNLLSPLKKRFAGAVRMLRGRYGYDEDGLATMHHRDFESDRAFQAAYARARATGSWGDQDIRYRAYIACWAARHCAAIDGDFVECGVNRGGTALAASIYADIERLDKTFFLVDTYNGFVPAYVSAEERGKADTYEYPECYDFVRRLFADFSHVRLVRGPVPDVLHQISAGRFAYVHLDMNCVFPEIAAAEHFWPQMSAGGLMLLDDYGFARHREQHRAFQQFAAKRGAAILGLPTGQGLLVHP